DGLGTFDAKGDVVGKSWPTSQAVGNVASLARFQLLRDHPELGFGIFDAVRSVDDGKWIVPLGRRLETPSGEVAGVVAAPGRIAYFQYFYRDMRLEPGTNITLTHQNGPLLARHPPLEAALGKRFPVDGMLAARAKGQDEPSRSVSPVDGGERFGTLQLVPD